MALKDTSIIPTESLDHVGDFILSISQAMRTQLMEAILQLEVVPLIPENVAPILKRPGVYQLFVDGRSVYVGKAVADLNSRLENHRRKISGRYDATGNTGAATPLIESLSFRCMYTNVDIDSLGPEKMLIQQFKNTNETPWNNTGFGNKDPGVKRDTSTVKLAHFDRLFPIDLGVEITPKARVLKKGTVPVENLNEALTIIKTEMPFLFRYSKSHPNVRLYKSIDVSKENVAASSRTVRDWLSWIADLLPIGWSITSLPGYVIAYEESDVSKYMSRTQVWHAQGGSHTIATHTPEFVHGKVEEIDDDEEGDEED